MCPPSSEKDIFNSSVRVRSNIFMKSNYDNEFTLTLTKIFTTLDATFVSVSCANNYIYASIFHNTYDTYILIVHHSDMTNVTKDVRTEVMKLKEYSEWNPRAMFLVLLTEALSHQEEIAEALLSELWRSSYISNAIVLSPTQDTILEDDLKTKNVEPRVNLYSFFPYSPPGNCGNITKAFLLDQWVVDGNGRGRFLRNSMLFPNKIPHNFHRCPITVSGFVHPPFVVEIKNSSEDSKELIYENGIGVRIVDVFAKLMNLSIRYREPPPNDEMWGSPVENGSWTGVTGEISSEEELINSHLELVISPTIAVSFPELEESPYKRRNYCEDLEVCLHLIAFEKEVAIINSAVDMSYLTAKYMDGYGNPII
ncbi:hypothetical protein ANN_05511, partial [Periplaneta americana]